MSSHATSPTPKSAPGAGGSVQKIFFVIAAILFLIWGYRSCTGKKNTTSSGSTPTAVKIYEVMPDGSLMLKRTIKSLPDTATFDYKFELESQGQPIKLKFPGIGWKKFSGLGRTLPVKGRWKGVVYIDSDK